MHEKEKSLIRIAKAVKIICYILLFLVPTIIVIAFISSLLLLLLQNETVVYAMLIMTIVLMVITLPLGVAYFVLSIFMLIYANNKQLESNKSKKNSIIVGILGIVYFNVGLISVIFSSILNMPASPYIAIIIYCIQVCLLIISLVKINAIMSLIRKNKKVFIDQDTTNITATF